MSFPTSMQESSRGLPDTHDPCLGLQSCNLTRWDRSQSTQDSDAAAQTSTRSVLSMSSSSIRNVLGKLRPSFLPLDPIAEDPSENLSTPLLKTSQLDSRSSSPLDLDTSGLSSDSNHLSNLMSDLHISPTVPFLPRSGVSRDPQEMGARSQPDFDPAILVAVTSSLASALEKLPGPSAWPSWDLLDVSGGPFSIERRVKLNRQMAAVNEATYTWSGQLPPRKYKNPVYSCKVFLGGVPWIITAGELIDAFRPFGFVSVQWPMRDGNMPKGYVYLVFKSEKAVRALLQACCQGQLRPKGFNEYYFKMSRRKKHHKEVQVIPWVLTDSNFVHRPLQGVEPSKMVFVGNLHGMLNAEALAAIMDDLFGGVVSARINTDKYKYPIGSGCVTFNNQCSYMRAVIAAFVKIKTIKFTKKIQIDPYLEDSMCQVCSVQPGPFFCRDQICFKYFCRSCWYWKHSVEVPHCHRLLIRNQNRDSN